MPLRAHLRARSSSSCNVTASRTACTAVVSRMLAGSPETVDAVRAMRKSWVGGEACPPSREPARLPNLRVRSSL